MTDNPIRVQSLSASRVSATRLKPSNVAIQYRYGSEMNSDAKRLAPHPKNPTPAFPATTTATKSTKSNQADYYKSYDKQTTSKRARVHLSRGRHAVGATVTAKLRGILKKPGQKSHVQKRVRFSGIPSDVADEHNPKSLRKRVIKCVPKVDHENKLVGFAYEEPREGISGYVPLQDIQDTRTPCADQLRACTDQTKTSQLPCYTPSMFGWVVYNQRDLSYLQKEHRYINGIWKPIHTY